jgi:hypothetical protein
MSKSAPGDKNDRQRRDAILARIAECDTPTLVRLAALLDGRAPQAPSGSAYLGLLKPVSDSDVVGLRAAERSYGVSWKLRGGVDTFHMLLRKWERIEGRLATDIAPTASAPGASPYDVFDHVAADQRSDGLIDDIRDLRRYLMLIEAEISARSLLKIQPGASGTSVDSGRGFLDYLVPIAETDLAVIQEKERAYGDSWMRNGGIGAFMIFARKWDRIKQRVITSIAPDGDSPGAARDNILEHIAADRRSEGVMEDIQDLRRVLLLVEAEMAAREEVSVGSARDNRDQ